MPRHVNIKLIMNVYKKLIKNKCNKIAAKDLEISETHVGRIANFLVLEFFLFNISPQILLSVIQDHFNPSSHVPLFQ